MKKLAVLSFLGTNLDAPGRGDRWKRWRPNVALARQPDFRVARLDLIHDPRHAGLAQSVAADVATASPDTAVTLHAMKIRDPWDFSEVYAGMRDFARAYPFDPDAEDYLVNITTGTHVAQICWFLLTEARFIPARLLQLSPPRGEDKGDYSGHHAIIDLDLSRYDAIATRFAAEQEEATSFLKSGIATRNATFNTMIDEIEEVAIRSRAPVLLTGPTGAGKSQLARRIYELKHARHQIAGAFVEVNCATLRGDHAMSALFGHVKGAFTGAQEARAGLLSAANGGMLFLDEIGELGLDEQAMCLRAIEEGRFLPVGADKEVKSEFQLIAGTNRDLGAAVRDGRFREDLLARLNLWTFRLPALAERPEDIEPNLDFELRRHGEREGRNATFNSEARALYLDFAAGPTAAWRANFRDLSASVTRMATLAPQGRIDEPTVRAEIARLKALWSESRPARTSDEAILRKILPSSRIDEFDLFDQVQLAAVIKICRESASLSEAGRRLFSQSRLTKTSGNDADRLRKYLARFSLSFADCRTERLSDGDRLPWQAKRGRPSGRSV